MTIVRWEPLRELSSLQTEMNRLFNTVFDTPVANGGSRAAGSPPWTCVETADDFVLRADLPGMTPGGRQDRARGHHAHHLRRAHGRARGARGGLLPRSSARSAASRAR